MHVQRKWRSLAVLCAVQCGSTWYQPQYAGTTVQYVVVNPPR